MSFLFGKGGSSVVREASHAGSWYSDDKDVLGKQLDGWLEEARSLIDEKTLERTPKAIVVPHAGYRFSGQTAAYSFALIKPEKVKKVVLMGPSHKKWFEGVAVSDADEYDTPFGGIKLDKGALESIRKATKGGKLKIADDENEHSLEMQLPFLKRVMGDQDFELIPILLSGVWKDVDVSQQLLEFFDDPEVLFVISSDFTHWGSRFQYQIYDKEEGEIWESIQASDNVAIGHVVDQEADSFTDYVLETGITICGRGPIRQLLLLMGRSEKQFEVDYLAYDQSSKCRTQRDSSVSYAAVAVFGKGE